MALIKYPVHEAEQRPAQLGPIGRLPASRARRDDGETIALPELLPPTADAAHRKPGQINAVWVNRVEYSSMMDWK